MLEKYSRYKASIGRISKEVIMTYIRKLPYLPGLTEEKYELDSLILRSANHFKAMFHVVAMSVFSIFL